MIAAVVIGPPVAFLGSFGGAIDFIFNERESAQEGSGVMVGGLDQVWELMSTQAAISVVALLMAIALALPVGLYLGCLLYTSDAADE